MSLSGTGSKKSKPHRHHKDKDREKTPEKTKKNDNRTIDLEEDDENPLMDKLPLESVIKVSASLSEHRFESPWQVGRSEDVSGSGFSVLDNNYILTNAHVVEKASYITIRKFGCSDSVPANIVCISYDCDLALLQIYQDDEYKDYLNDVKSLQFAKVLPFLQDEVLVIGYPEGGDNISCTRGIVSRVEPTEYTPSTRLLAVQIDAAVNHGNSGGPVFKGEKVIGVAFMGLDDADGIGYIIPSTIVTHFLNEFVEKNSFGGFCSLGFDVQKMENKRMRQAYQMGKGVTGLLIKHVDPMSPAAGLVLPGDILTSFDGTKIENDGSVKFRKRELIYYEYLVQQKHVASSANLGILRLGVTMDIPVTLTHIPDMCQTTKAEEPYYICWAGLVFVPLSLLFMEANWDDGDAPPALTLASQSPRKYVDQQYVVLTRILADDVNYGYEDECEKIVTKHNGVEIKNLKHLFLLISETKSGFVKIELSDNSILVFDAEEANKRTESILTKHKIPGVTNLVL
jgi:S1-C subfamily serine protease